MACDPNTDTVNDLFNAQCTKQSLFLFNICWEKNVPFSAPIMKHFPGRRIGQSGRKTVFQHLEIPTSCKYGGR